MAARGNTERSVLQVRRTGHRQARISNVHLARASHLKRYLKGSVTAPTRLSFSVGTKDEKRGIPAKEGGNSL